MIVLGIETATTAVGACVVRGDGCLAMLTARPGRQHAETLHPLIESVLRKSGLGFGDIELIGVDIGPGLFTGLRVGLAAAKAFAFALSVPIVGVNGLEVLIDDMRGSPWHVIPVIDMRRGEVAWQLPAGPIARGAPDVLRSELRTLEGEYLLVGEGAHRYQDTLLANEDGAATVHLDDIADRTPSVLGVARLSWARAASGLTSDLYGLSPLYLRDADAKANFAIRDRVPVAESGVRQ